MKHDGGIINMGRSNAECMPFGGGVAYVMSRAIFVGLIKGFPRDLCPGLANVRTLGRFKESNAYLNHLLG